MMNDDRNFTDTEREREMQERKAETETKVPLRRQFQAEDLPPASPAMTRFF